MNFSELRVVSWNCAGALRNKWHALEQFDADLLVIQECEDPAQAKDARYLEWAGHYLWAGPMKNKGIGVFARKGVRLERESVDVKELKYFLPCRINGDWPLLATWTAAADSGAYRYIGQLWLLLQSNQEFLNHRYGMVVGDFNSNSQWDKQHRGCCHSDVVHELSKIGLESAYHRYFGEAQGEESTPTFFLQRNRSKSFHIDYAFLGKHWSAKRCEVGSVDSWISLSDHMPLSMHLSTEDAQDFGVA